MAPNNQVYVWGLDAVEVASQLNHLHLGTITETTAIVNLHSVREEIKNGAAKINSILCGAVPPIPLDCDLVDPNTAQEIREAIVSYVSWQLLLRVGAPAQPTTDAERDWLTTYAQLTNADDPFKCEVSPGARTSDSIDRAKHVDCDWDWTNGCNF